jgi:sortase A
VSTVARGDANTALRDLRARRVHGVALAALLALGAASLAVGFWLPLKAALAEELLNRAWSAARHGEGHVRPWPWADTWPVARLSLPPAAHSGPLIVLAGATGRELAFAPGLLDGSAQLGEPGVAVIAAHRDTHFRALARLALGDRFEIERADGARFVYAVTSTDVIDTKADTLRLDASASTVALVTCYPFDALVPGGTLRYVVTGELAGDGDPAPAQARRRFVL